MAESTTPNAGRRPALEEQMAGIKIAGWPGKYGWSFKIGERSYQAGGDGNWQQTPYYRTSDLVILGRLIDRMIDRALSTPAPPPSQDSDDSPTN